MDVVTIDGRLALDIKETGKAIGGGRSTVYRLIDGGKLEVVYFDRRPKITARSILKLLGLADKPCGDAPPAPIPTGARRRGRPPRASRAAASSQAA